jgi:hypothetical protein
MRRVFAIVLLALSATVAAIPLHFAWDAGANYPAGIKYELQSNGASASGIITTDHVLEVPIQNGEVIDARVRAVPPVGYQCGEPLADCPPSPWATLVQTLPAEQQFPPARAAILFGGNPIMAAPTYVAEYPTAFNSTTSPKTAMSAVSINSGDVLIAVAAHEHEVNTALGVTENGSASMVVAQGLQTANYCETRAWSYTATGNETLTVTFTKSEAYFGGNVVRFSGSNGVGASNIAQSASGSPSVSLTTTQANSAIVVIVSDWNAVSGTQTFTNNFSGTPSALTDYPGDGVRYGVAIAYFPDAGAAGSKTVGMSAPTGQKWTIIAVEVKGTASAATAVPVFMNQYRQRRS